jgi:hypothetical protein
MDTVGEMIPLLDAFNHDSDGAHFEYVEAADGGGGGSALMKRAVSRGGEILSSYGQSKGNRALLCNYGFCRWSNHPDEVVLLPVDVLESLGRRESDAQANELRVGLFQLLLRVPTGGGGDASEQAEEGGKEGGKEEGGKEGEEMQTETQLAVSFAEPLSPQVLAVARLCTMQPQEMMQLVGEHGSGVVSRLRKATAVSAASDRQALEFVTGLVSQAQKQLLGGSSPVSFMHCPPLIQHMKRFLARLSSHCTRRKNGARTPLRRARRTQYGRAHTSTP